ncbi:FG-GAP repeat domain-containing protein [Myxococcota bacterium]
MRTEKGWKLLLAGYWCVAFAGLLAACVGPDSLSAVSKIEEPDPPVVPECSEDIDCLAIISPAGCADEEIRCIANKCRSWCNDPPDPPPPNCSGGDDAPAVPQAPSCESPYPHGLHFLGPTAVGNSGIPSGSSALHIVLEQIDTDAHLDVAVAYVEPSAQGGIAVFAGDGHGGFNLLTQLSLGDFVPVRIAVTDLNGDCLNDIAAYGGNTSAQAPNTAVQVVINNKDSLSVGQTLQMDGHLSRDGALGLLIAPLRASDIDRDGDVDLAIAVSTEAELSDTRIHHLLNDGLAHFEASSVTHMGMTAVDMVLEDFNRDGFLDLAVADASTYSTGVFLGNSQGGYQFTWSAEFGMEADYPEMIAAGDYNDDGIIDLRTLHESCYDVYYQGNGDGTFDDPITFSTMKDPTFHHGTGDFNADGNLDLAVIGYGSDISFLLLKSDGTVEREINSMEIGIEFSWNMGQGAVAAGDLNYDGVDDVILGAAENSVLWGDSGNGAADFPLLHVLIGNPCEQE